MQDKHSNHIGKLIVDGDHYTYWNKKDLIYVRDGGTYNYSKVGPHFLDLGVMGNCRNTCYDCYMKNNRCEKNMNHNIADKIIYDLRDSLCQISFGGAGDPIDYEKREFLPILGTQQLISAYKDKYGEIKYPLTSEEEAQLDLFSESINNIAKCITINPRTRVFTKDEVIWMSQFEAVGLSCGTGILLENNAKENILQLLRQAEILSFEERPKFILHVIVNEIPKEINYIAHLFSHECVDGLLLLAMKNCSNNKKEFNGPFYDKSIQRKFWKSVSDMYRVIQKPIAIDSCLAPFLDRNEFPYCERQAIHPCDAGRFSIYIHADCSMWLCSCGKKPVESWDKAIKTKQNCNRVGKGHVEPRLLENPSVVIQKGPMTNSSSASYFVVAPKKTNFKLEIIDFAKREALKEPYFNCFDKYFSWAKNNNKLVRVTQGEWAAWCAEEISISNSPLKTKLRLDKYTKKILEGSVFYLVANRDDEEIPPTRYNKEDVSDDKNIILVRASYE